MRLFVLLALGCNPLGEVEVDPPLLDQPVVPEVATPDSDSGGASKDTVDSDSASSHSGDSGDSAATDSADTGTSATETGDTGTSGTETGDSADTGTSSTETGDSADTGTSSTETGDSADTGTSSTETGGSADTGTSSTETGDSVDTGVSSTETGETVDTGTSPTETGDTAAGEDTADGGDTGDLGWSAIDTADSATTVDSGWSGVDTADSATSGGGTGGSADTADTGDSADTAVPVDTGKPADTGNNFPVIDTGPVLVDTDTSVYTPASCDSGDTGAGCGDVIRFVALGDAGTGDYRQVNVANAIEAVCAVEGCDFALYLGDNLYPAGASDVTDALWTSNFEVPYAGLGFQFYAVLGNHDYGGYFDTGVAAVQVAYTAYSSKWYMPSRYYTEVIGDLTVIGLDSQALQLGNGADQEAWIPGALAGISTTWTIAIGHHPYISNGPHGDAGEYDGRAGEGVAFKDFFDSYMCGAADVYLAGHDHALQWLQVPATCDTLFLVAGGGGSGRYPIVGTHPADFEDSNNGFLWVELDGNLFTGVFYDATGTELYRASFTK